MKSPISRRRHLEERQLRPSVRELLVGCREEVPMDAFQILQQTTFVHCELRMVHIYDENATSLRKAFSRSDRMDVRVIKHECLALMPKVAAIANGQMQLLGIQTWDVQAQMDAESSIRRAEVRLHIRARPNL